MHYIVYTRPDVAFTIGYVSIYMESPTTEHLALVKHLMRYLACTRFHVGAYTLAPVMHS
jgi:hypothetical protein